MTEPYKPGAQIEARPASSDLRPGDVLIWTSRGVRPASDHVKVIERRKETDDGWWMTDGSGLADYVWDRDTLVWTTLPALLAAYRAERAVVDAVLALTYASDDGTEYEHNLACEGEAECPKCWALNIRAAIQRLRALDSPERAS